MGRVGHGCVAGWVAARSRGRASGSLRAPSPPAGRGGGAGVDRLRAWAFGARPPFSWSTSSP
eukprot:1667880-Pyramimonas_sp.AAC.1